MNADEQESPQGCTPEALVEKVARAMCASDFDGDTNVYDLKNNNFRADYLFRARTAIGVLKPLLRAEALEEAAKVAEYRIGAAEWSAETNSGYECASEEIAAAIRALKEDKQDAG